MSLRDLNPATRRRLRWHGWLLTLCCVAVGVLTSWLLLRVFDVDSPAIRYGAGAVVMYAVGMVLGVRVWLVAFAASVREEAGRLGHAAKMERAAFNADTERAALHRRIHHKFEWADVLGNIGDLFQMEELALVVIVPALILGLIGLLMLAGLLPVMLVDGVAAMLAEVAVQFVFGALPARRALRPRDPGDPWLDIVGRTWIVGLMLLVASVCAGWVLQQTEPGARSIGDLFRR